MTRFFLRLVRPIGMGETSMLLGIRSLQETLTRWNRPLRLRFVDGPRPIVLRLFSSDSSI